jgi:hypothetical protein
VSRYINGALSRPTRSWGARCPWPDTSKATAKPLTPRTPRQPIPTRMWFAFQTGTRSVRAPEGYAFNGRGDLVRRLA